MRDAGKQGRGGWRGRKKLIQGFMQQHAKVIKAYTRLQITGSVSDACTVGVLAEGVVMAGITAAGGMVVSIG